MTTRTRTAQRAHLAAAWAPDIAARIDATLRNLEDHAPGFPSTTPGSGSVGGGGSSTSSRTETLALMGIDADDAMRDHAAIVKAVDAMYAAADLLHTLTARWGYRTAGEWNPLATSPQAKATEHESNAGRWCSHHARHQMAEPVGAKGRGGLCRWCYEFQAEHGTKLPPLDIIVAKAEGRRITQSMVRGSLAGPSIVHQGKRKGK
jgi:hypothetical protein